MKRVYIGPKQSTIENSNFFDYSITLFGNNDENNISYSENNLDNILEFEYWNPDSNPREINIYNNLLKTIKEPFEIMAHDYKIVSQCEIPSNATLICKNDEDLISLFNNKKLTRELFKNLIPLLNYVYVSGKDFDYKSLSNNDNPLVVQHPLGSGGAKTFLCTKDNYQNIKLNDNDIYMVSKYIKDNIPYNIHCIISESEFEIFPPSMQVLDITDKIEYIDSEYEIEIEKKLKERLLNYTTKICVELQKMGYRGILGIDYIYADGELYFIEINPRFQGSTRKLDKILKDNELPSIFEYNYLAFSNKKLLSTRKLTNSVLEEKEN